MLAGAAASEFPPHPAGSKPTRHPPTSIGAQVIAGATSDRAETFRETDRPQRLRALQRTPDEARRATDPTHRNEGTLEPALTRRPLLSPREVVACGMRSLSMTLW
jgi:hypothetical protein